MAGLKIKNQYCEDYPNYETTPKAVIAAVAYSLAMRLCNDNFDDAEELLREEWSALYQANVVSQKPK